MSEARPSGGSRSSREGSVVAIHPSNHYEDGEPDEETFSEALLAVLRSLDGLHLRCLIMGGLGTVAHSRPRQTRDIDLFVHPDDAAALLDHLEDDGFDVQLADPTWLHKAWMHGVLIDVIFRSTGDMYLDDEMLERATEWEFRGLTGRVIGPEDLTVIKAVTTTEQGSHHWYDALSILTRHDLDWDYLIRRAARHGPRRVLALLLFAESNDVAVPDRVIRSLFDLVHPPAPVPAAAPVPAPATDAPPAAAGVGP